MEGFDGTLGDGERGIGDGFFEIQPDDAAEATAFRAGSEWRVEGKEGRGGGAEGEAGGGVVPGGGEGLGDSARGVLNAGVAFAEVEGGFEGLEEAGVVGFGESEAVLKDLDGGRNEFRAPIFRFSRSRGRLLHRSRIGRRCGR